MKLTLLTLLTCFLATTLNAQSQPKSFDVNGTLSINPIFSGDYTDPSILRDGENYYIVHSFFNYYPGLTIWHSRDMVNWTPIANALHKYVGNVWAPDLVKYGNKFYIYFPVQDKNYVVTTDKIEGPWSEPADLKIGNIDPGHVVDEKGNRYLYFSSGFN